MLALGIGAVALGYSVVTVAVTALLVRWSGAHLGRSLAGAYAGPYLAALVALLATLDVGAPNLARILQALDTQVPYLVVDNMTIRPLNAFRGFKPAPGQEPENNVQLDVSALAYPDAPRPAAPPK